MLLPLSEDKYLYDKLVKTYNNEVDKYNKYVNKLQDSCIDTFIKALLNIPNNKLSQNKIKLNFNPSYSGAYIIIM